ncbi:MAG: hypothetical protein AB7U98_01205 [Candidatus Nitrosocosmicus sp.]
MASDQISPYILNQSNENKNQNDTQRLTLQQVLDILNQQEELSTTITQKSRGWSGINFWNCSGLLVNVWYDDQDDSRPWIKHGSTGSSYCGGPPHITLSYINGHTYDIVVSSPSMPGCSGDWPRDYECGKEFLYNEYGNSSQIKRSYNIYR